MHDYTPTVRACKDCGMEFERWSKAKPPHAGSSLCRCRDCYNAYAKSRPSYLAKREEAQAKNPSRKVCRCGAEHQRRSQVCEDCAKARRRELERDRSRGRPLSNWTRRCRCGVTFTATHRGPYCSSECPARPRRERNPKPPRKTRQCLGCGETILPPRQRCPECARLHNISRITSLYWVAAESVEVRKAAKWRYEIVAYLRERDGCKCGICGKPMLFDVKTGPSGDPMGATIDHIVPRSLGGSDGLENLQLAHWRCNNKKGNRVGVQQLRLVV